MKLMLKYAITAVVAVLFTLSISYMVKQLLDNNEIRREKIIMEFKIANAKSEKCIDGVSYLVFEGGKKLEKVLIFEGERLPTEKKCSN